MGFGKGDGMAGVERERVPINLVESDNKTWVDNASFSIGVTDLEALYSQSEARVFTSHAANQVALRPALALHGWA